MEKKKRNDDGNLFSAGGIGGINTLIVMDSLMSLSMGTGIPKEKQQPTGLTPFKKEFQKENIIPIVLGDYGKLKTENWPTRFGQYNPKTTNPNKTTEQ